MLVTMQVTVIGLIALTLNRCNMMNSVTYYSCLDISVRMYSCLSECNTLMYVCVYVCMYDVCMCMYVCVCMYVHIYVGGVFFKCSHL